MTEEIKTGGLAFPFVPGEGSALYESEGMTLRDYFAAKAMDALIPIYWQSLDEYESATALIKCMTENAYETADAMIKSRG
jgi:hypothetical protein